MATYAVVASSGSVVNRIVLDDVDAWTPKAGQTIVEEKGTTFEIGGTYINSVYTPPVRPPGPVFVPPDSFDVWDTTSMKITFNHENRVRALEGKPALTAAQFKTAVKALIT